MSAAGSSSQADQTTPEKTDQPSFNGFDILEQIYDGVLWPTDSDFSKVCSCRDCLKKIETLNEFEKELNAKMRLINEDGSQIEAQEYLCTNIFFSVHATKDILEFLEKKLNAKSGVGVPWTLEKGSTVDKLNQMFKRIGKILRGAGFFGGPDDKEPDDVDDDDSATVHDEHHNIFNKIDNVRFYYRNTQIKDEVYLRLQDIRNLENDLGMDEVHKLEKQIECVKKIPVEKLQTELEELLPEIRKREYHSVMYEKARTCIYDASYRCIIKGKEFWKGSPLLTGNEHSSNGLEKTLKSLITEVDLFKKKWKDEFAHVFTPRDRSNPKRQLVE